MVVNMVSKDHGARGASRNSQLIAGAPFGERKKNEASKAGAKEAVAGVKALFEFLKTFFNGLRHATLFLCENCDGEGGVRYTPPPL